MSLVSEKLEIPRNNSKTKDFFVKMHNFVSESKSERPDINDLIINLTKRLDKITFGTCTIAINDGDKETNWFLKFTTDGCKIEKYLKELANSEISMNADTAYAILSGKMSPTYAFGLGKIIIKGDVELLLSVYEKLVDEKGILAPCRRLQ